MRFLISKGTIKKLVYIMWFRHELIGLGQRLTNNETNRSYSFLVGALLMIKPVVCDILGILAN